MILNDEVIEDIDGNIKIIQKKNGFRFGTDAVLLSRFARCEKNPAILDLCTGNGVIPLLLHNKTNKKICGIEIQESVADMAKRSAELNKLSDKIEIICGDLREAEKYYPKRSFDVITCNPPYIKSGGGIINDSDSKIIARHEVMCCLEDVIRISSLMLTQRGRLFMVHKPFRLADILCLMRKYRIEPKRFQCVHTDISAPPSLILVEGLFDGGSDIKIDAPIIL